jgi:hypothetical protein
MRTARVDVLRVAAGLRKLCEDVHMPHRAPGRELDVPKCGKRHGDKGGGCQQCQHEKFKLHDTPPRDITSIQLDPMGWLETVLF